MSDVCECGHLEIHHIYEVGACRPGFICPAECKEFSTRLVEPPQRPSIDVYFLAMAEAASARAECVRRKVGAIVVKNGRLVGHGFNGALPGAPSCLDGACPRGRQSYDSVASGTDYWNCIADHAERNALRNTDPENRAGSTVYINHEPCNGCRTLMRSVGVARAVWSVEGQVVSINFDYFDGGVQL